MLTDRVEQVKGVTYSVSQFLGEEYATIMARLGRAPTVAFPPVSVTATSAVGVVGEAAAASGAAGAVGAATTTTAEDAAVKEQVRGRGGGAGGGGRGEVHAGLVSLSHFSQLSSATSDSTLNTHAHHSSLGSSPVLNHPT